jgi:phenylacetate-CoA ligase
MFQLASFQKLKAIYEKSPNWLKRSYATIPFRYRAGRVYHETRALIEATEFLPADRLAELQNALLVSLLRHAGAHVPYYEGSLRECAIKRLSDDEVLDCFHMLPLVAKATYQDDRNQFHARGGVYEPVFVDNTGGSSGTPFSFVKPNSMYSRELAYMSAQWERVGYRPGDRKLTLRGRTFSQSENNRRWCYNPVYNELVLSSYHLDRETLQHSLKEVRRFRPRFIHGYPSAIVTFLRTIVENSLTIPEGIVAVLCGSEPIYDYQREFIRKTLSCRVYSWYGQSECVLLGGECEYSTDYHLFPLYGVMELVDDHGNRVTAPGIEGEIIGTSLNNLAMSFLRYRTGDRGILAPEEPCACGRSFMRLTQVTGRQQYLVYTVDRTPIPSTALIFGQHFNAFGKMYGMQLFQDEPGKLIVRVVQRPSYSETDERELHEKIESAVDGRLQVYFEYLDRLPLNSAGKTDFMVQQVRI